MQPAYPIPLAPSDLQTLGELTAIVGQIDEAMTVTVSGLIQADRPTTDAVMGSSKVADNANIWASLIRLRSKDEDVLWQVEHALKEIQEVSAGRNDFVHAFFEQKLTSIEVMVSDGNSIDVYGREGPPTARRVRSQNKQRPVTELQQVRDRAARLSCLIAHIGWQLAPHGITDGGRSPWLARLAPSLPPRLDTAAARKEKAQQPRQRPSRGKPQSQ